MKLRFPRWLKILTSVVFVAVIISSCSKDNSSDNSITYSSIEKEILVLVNQYRDSLGLEALVMNDIIFIECRQHSRDMANNNTMNHDGFTDRANNIFAQFGGTRAAENVAYGQTTAKQVVTDWLNSPGHRVNIEGDFNYTGISVVKNSQGVNYFTQIFVKK